MALLFLIWLVIVLVFVAFLLLFPAAWRHAIHERYSGGRPVACPRDRRAAVVNIDLRRAVGTVMDGSPHLRLSGCTCWPERANCNQQCLSQAIHAQPYKPGQTQPGKKQIYHLPVLLAASAAWYLGMIWHSHYLFREQWALALGLTHAQVSHLVTWLSPHLLSVAVCLLFAYGVAWLLALIHRKGVLPGVLVAVLLCAALIATSLPGIARLPRGLFAMEAGYILLATVIVGATVGGLYDKLVLRWR